MTVAAMSASATCVVFIMTPINVRTATLEAVCGADASMPARARITIDRWIDRRPSLNVGPFPIFAIEEVKDSEIHAQTFEHFSVCEPIERVVTRRHEHWTRCRVDARLTTYRCRNEFRTPMRVRIEADRKHTLQRIDGIERSIGVAVFAACIRNA